MGVPRFAAEASLGKQAPSAGPRRADRRAILRQRSSHMSTLDAAPSAHGCAALISSQCAMLPLLLSRVASLSPKQ